MVYERMAKEKCQGPKWNSLQTSGEKDKERRDKGALMVVNDTHNKLLALDEINGRFVYSVNLQLVVLVRGSISSQAATVWRPHLFLTGL